MIVGPRLGHVRREVLDALGVIDLRADRDRQELADRVLVGVGERQEGEEDLVAEAEALEQSQSARAVGHDVAVGEHHALGRAAGARGVDEAG